MKRTFDRLDAAIDGVLDGEEPGVLSQRVFGRRRERTGSRSIAVPGSVKLETDGAGHGVFQQHAEETGLVMEAFFARMARADAN